MEYPTLWAVAVAAILPMLVGSLWYGPLFGKKWMEMMEITEEDIKASFNALKSYGGSFVASLVQAYILGMIIASLGDASWMNGVCIGLLCWLGFTVSFGFQAVAFESKKMGLYMLSMAYNLIVFVLMGVVLGLWAA